MADISKNYVSRIQDTYDHLFLTNKHLENFISNTHELYTLMNSILIYAESDENGNLIIQKNDHVAIVEHLRMFKL
jgi:hypothetical protein